MSFTWNGQVVNNIIPIAASYSISDAIWLNQTATSQHLVEDRIKKELALKLSEEIMQFVDIQLEHDYSGLKRTYYARAHMAIIKQHSPLPNPTSFGSISTSSGWNGTAIMNSGSIVNTSSYVNEYEKFRVCEYTKNGKVTRVELQYNVDGMWEKIPRVKIEE